MEDKTSSKLKSMLDSKKIRNNKKRTKKKKIKIKKKMI